MAEVWFYHLERRSASQELPGLLMRGLARDLRMAIVTTTTDRVRELSQQLWSLEDTAFLPHGFEGEPFPETQPVYVCTDDQPPNGASFRFYVDGTGPVTLEGLERATILFDGNSEEAVQAARQQWRSLKPLASAVKYWRQNEEGRWVDQASG